MSTIRSVGARAALLATLGAGLGSAPVLAHHSFGLYDMSKSTQIEGTVTKFEWSNPHSWLFVLVSSAHGAEASYGFEMQSVGEIVRKGWTKTALKPGDKVTVKFHPLRDGRPAGLLMTVTNADGVLIGSAPSQQALAPPAPPPAPAGS